MSTVATFTLRDLNRQSAKVLAAVRKYGSVVIKTRAGEVFTLAPTVPTSLGGKKPKALDPSEEFFRRGEERAKRFREMGFVPPPASEMERINRIIAGEE
ncbi:MAG: hypothetical protein ACOYMN_18590 [Roseimicrobium sp.]